MMTNEALREINKNIEDHLGLFSEAETERNQKTYCTFRPSELHNMEESINELLAIREAGDEEVEKLRDDAGCKEFHEDRIEALDKLRDIAIARGQQLREAQAEIERLKGARASPHHEDGSGGYYDLFPGGIYQ